MRARLLPPGRIESRKLPYFGRVVSHPSLANSVMLGYMPGTCRSGSQRIQRLWSYDLMALYKSVYYYYYYYYYYSGLIMWRTRWGWRETDGSAWRSFIVSSKLHVAYNTQMGTRYSKKYLSVSVGLFASISQKPDDAVPLVFTRTYRGCGSVLLC